MNYGTYNMVVATDDNSPSVIGMLFTDKELAKLQWYERRNLFGSQVQFIKVKAYYKHLYYCFGARFASRVKTVETIH